jgi:hypothetical protein
MRHHLYLWAGSAILVGGIAYAAQVVAPPKARYQMDVSTTSGFLAGGANPMKMMFGGRGGSSVAHSLVLRLGSTLPPAGAPSADHFMPAGMGLGLSVPLVTPTPGTAKPGTPDAPGEMTRPKGRLLIFWGCGAHVGPGQPVVFDFARPGQGQAPTGLYSTAVPADPGPSFATSRTYGDWPNSKAGKGLKPTSSLLGDHRVAGNYSPEMKFALDQDFMPALNARAQEQGDESQLLSWNAIPVATGYYAMLFGAKDAGNNSADMVMWSSSGSREIGGGLTDWLPPSLVASLIGRKVVMPPSQTSCQIPAEVKKAAPGFMLTQLFAYGPERNFAYPPRPASPKVAWKPDWTARVRYRSSTSLMLGMPGMEDGGSGGDEPAKPKKCKPRITLGGIKPC